MNQDLVALPSYEFKSTSVPPTDAIEAYERDGVVSLRGAFSRYSS